MHKVLVAGDYDSDFEKAYSQTVSLCSLLLTIMTSQFNTHVLLPNYYSHYLQYVLYNKHAFSVSSIKSCFFKF